MKANITAVRIIPFKPCSLIACHYPLDASADAVRRAEFGIVYLPRVTLIWRVGPGYRPSCSARR